MMQTEIQADTNWVRSQ